MAAAIQAWRRVVAGTGGVVIVTGVPGIGKTRFAAEVMRRASEDGGLVLHARCAAGSTRPYQPFVDMLDALPEAGGIVWTGGSREVADGVVRLVRHLAGDRPVAVVVDDLDKAGGGTVDLIGELVRGSAGARVLVVAVATPDAGQSGPVTRALRDLRRGPGAVAVTLGGLDAAACAALARASVAPGAARVSLAGLLAEAGGNPFMVRELLAAAADGCVPGVVPPRVGALVEAWLVPLPADARALVDAAAIVGTGVDIDMVGTGVDIDMVGTGVDIDMVGTGVDIDMVGTGVDVDVALAGAAAGLAEEAASAALDIATCAGVLREEGGDRYRFTADLVRRAVGDRLGGRRRRLLHGRAADAIEAGGPSGRRAELARHRAAAAGPGGDARAAGAALAAAREASAQGAPDEARRWARVAVDAGSDDAVAAEAVTELGLALGAGGRRRRREHAARRDRPGDRRGAPGGRRPGGTRAVRPGPPRSRPARRRRRCHRRGAGRRAARRARLGAADRQAGGAAVPGSAGSARRDGSGRDP